MADPFAAAAEALFRAPGSDAGLYTPQFGTPFDVRVIRSTNPVDITIGARVINAGATVLQLLRSSFAGKGEPKRHEVVIIGDAGWTLMTDPTLDVEGVSWLAEAAPV